MKILSKNTKFASLGKPGTAFTKGFQRRLKKIASKINLKDKVILDQGCGQGVWMFEFAKFTDPKNVFGSDIDKENLNEFKKLKKELDADIPEKNFKICPAEKLNFEDNQFDIVFSNEVLEHVDDDTLAVEEAHRVLKKGGYFVIFTPNRGWPFETHGMFYRGKYYWGNIPFLPWMPRIIRKKLAPHVRNYSNPQIRELLSEQEWEITNHTHVYSGFDKLSKKYGLAGKALQKAFHLAEKTPLHHFGISHFLIARKR